MLFQPSNILPDVINGIGNGTVDVTNGLDVSWQINGNSAMTAYEIRICLNDTNSTEMYTTDMVTSASDSNLPATGVDYQGNPTRFSTSISASDLSSAGISNGNEYKLQIIQYYVDAGSETKSIAQRSMSVFLTRTEPSLSITAIAGNTLAKREYSFTAYYSQAQLDPLAWVRWKLYDNTGEQDLTSQYDADLLFDTGKMYNVISLRFDYDAFVNDGNYYLVLEIETSNGIRKSASYQFNTHWSVSILEDLADPTAKRVNKQSTAVRVVWSGFRYITGEPSGIVEIKNSMAVLPDSNSSIVWDSVNGGALSITQPWVLMMRTKLNYKDASILKLYDSSNNAIVEITYDLANRRLQFRANGVTNSITYSIVDYNDALKIMVTPTRYYFQIDGYRGALRPSESLKPSSTLKPQDVKTPYVHTETNVISSFVQSDIAKIETSGVQNIDYIQVVSGSGNVTETTIEEMFDRFFESGYDPNEDVFSGTEFLATFENGNLDAGKLSIDGTTLSGWSIYRESQRTGKVLHLIDTDIAASSLYDYGCGSNQGKYRYAIYPIGDQKYITAGLYTNWIEPCYENWSIVEAVNTGTDAYKVINEYVFGKNFTSGSVSNNNTPTVSKNFTRYATVQMDHANYQSGTLSGLIGYIGYVSYITQEGDSLEQIALRYGTTVDQILADNENLPSLDSLRAGQIIKIFYPDGITAYHDDKKLRDDIWALSTTQHSLFLKSRKGDVIEIRIAGEISMETMDASPIQPLSVSIPWVQVGDATRARLIGGVG